MELKGKVALVLGAVKGIGKGIGLDLAAQGVKLILTRHDWKEAFDPMEHAFAQTGAEHEILTADLTQPDQVRGVARCIREKYGRLDILINNIERGGWPTVHGAYVEEQWDLEMATTLKAKHWVFDAVFDLLQAAPQGACVINVSSIAGIMGRTGPAALVFNDAYAAANRGVSALTETWARMGGGHIRVNELMLGIFETRHAQGTRGWKEVLTDSEKKSLIDHTLAGRTGSIADVVQAVNFMLRASYMNGAVLRLDGGFVLGGEPVPPMPKGIV